MEEPSKSPFTDEEYKDLLKQPGGEAEALKRSKDLLANKTGEASGVLVKLLTTHGMEEFLQELKLANFKADEADECISALHECFVLGMDPLPIYMQMIARSAGEQQAYVRMIIDGYTHKTQTYNYPKGFKPDRDQPKSGSSF